MIHRGTASAAAFLAAVTAATSAVISFTGGRESPVLLLLCLPVVLAVPRLPARLTTLLGLVVAGIYLALPGAHGDQPLGTFALTGAVVVFAIALAGALYARGLRHAEERLRAVVEEQETLLSVSQAMDAADKMDQAMHVCLATLRKLVPHVDGAAVYLLDDGRRWMVQEAVLGIAAPPPGLQRVAVPDDRADWSSDGPSRYYVPDTAARRDGPLGGLDPDAGSYAWFVLRSLRSPVGLLYVSSRRRRAFSSADLRLLSTCCDRLAVPIRKLRIQQSLESMAYTDPMTGLYNFRAFRSHLEDEFKRSVRYGHPLSLILLDLDGFKGINDRYGHPAGDQVLIAVAEIIRRCVRGTDVPVRYGGEEFAVVCPETDESAATAVAERIREAVAEARFHPAPEETCAVTASLGVAALPLHASDDHTLVDAADAALYAAKRAGKDRVIVAGGPVVVPAP